MPIHSHTHIHIHVTQRCLYTHTSLTGDSEKPIHTLTHTHTYYITYVYRMCVCVPVSDALEIPRSFFSKTAYYILYCILYIRDTEVVLLKDHAVGAHFVARAQKHNVAHLYMYTYTFILIYMYTYTFILIYIYIYYIYFRAQKHECRPPIFVYNYLIYTQCRPPI